MLEIRRVLCPIDFSDHSRHALGHAVAFSGRYGIPLTVVHIYSTAPVVLPPPTALMGAPATVPEGSASAETRQDLIDEVRRFCEPLAAGESPEVVVLEGTPAKEIVRLADQVQTNLLVMGTHGRTGFERLFLGSVTEKVVRTTRTPVLTVPPKAAHSAEGSELYRTILCAVDFSDASARAVEHAMLLAETTGARVVLAIRLLRCEACARRLH